MKKTALTLLAIAAASLASSAFAQQKMDDMKAMDMERKPAVSKPHSHAMTHTVRGIVKSVDAASEIVTVAHEPVKSMKWPAMTMGFKVKDKLLLEKFTAGNQVKFEFKQDGKDYVVTAVK